jgi:hypothetical protein
MPPRQRTIPPRARPEAIHSSPSALASLSLLFLEDLVRRLSGHPLSDKYPTPTLVLFYVIRLYQVILFNCSFTPNLLAQLRFISNDIFDTSRFLFVLPRISE